MQSTMTAIIVPNLQSAKERGYDCSDLAKADKAMCTRRQRFVLCHIQEIRRKVLLAAAVVLCLVVVYFVFIRRKIMPTVFVIEEHHEALAYWFHAVDEGLIPKQGNVLIHIDGHSDESTPEFVTGMPQFQYPRNDHKLAFFLQKNDVFIQGAVMTGLLSRVIWVWPSWDERLIDEKEPYESKLVELGWFWEERDSGHTREPHFCQCDTWKVPRKDYTKKCTFINSSASTSDEHETIMAAGECHIKTSYLSEHIRDEHFLKIISDHTWIEKDTDIILDIDEDYFGCENVANHLVQDDLSWAEVEMIDQRLRRFLCPKFIRHEEIGNDFLRSLLQIFLKNCNLSGCSGTNLFTDLLNEAYDILVTEFRRHPSMFCGLNDFDVRDAWRRLAEIFYQMLPQHIKRIHDLGFCLSTSPKTLFFDEGRAEFTICHGLNPPNATIVFLHSPDKLEIINRSKLLLTLTQSILETLSLPLVTVCRSVRDGFTPRGLADFIEAEVLETLAQASDKEWQINYDDDLLGGRMGWASRN